jgi:uncharacterized protein YbbC (DUF1343 family)
MTKFFIWASLFFLLHCKPAPEQPLQSDLVTEIPEVDSQQQPIVMGSEKFSSYLPSLAGQRVGLVVNQSALVGQTHLLDTLLALGVEVKKIFVPEHGFRGDADAGAVINNSVDARTGLPILSLYGKNKKPTPEQLKDLDVLLYDIQDVGARFYTYISTLHYVMEACAEQGKKCVVLDRPNPNGDYVDGPVLKPGFTSFVGMHPIPVVHGLTVGELAQMINGEKWLANGLTCSLQVVPMDHYTHLTPYELPVKPSPNLPNYQSVRLYPSICFFEPTLVSLGRGTYQPFQILGYPGATFGDYTFTPVSIKGMSEKPDFKDQLCRGIDLTSFQTERRLHLEFLLDFYNSHPDKKNFFKDRRFFNLLAGTDELLAQIEQGLNQEAIRKSWQSPLSAYKAMRKQYLLYPDFE